MKLTERELELINSVCWKAIKTSNEIDLLSKEELLKLADLLSDLIGYNSEIDDIDNIGLEADNIISKILIALENRGEM